MPFVSSADCSRKFAAVNLKTYDTYLCAGGKNKTDTCHGDSGKRKFEVLFNSLLTVKFIIQVDPLRPPELLMIRLKPFCTVWFQSGWTVSNPMLFTPVFTQMLNTTWTGS